MMFLFSGFDLLFLRFLLHYLPFHLIMSNSLESNFEMAVEQEAV
jgi:hypothetical protein